MKHPVLRWLLPLLRYGLCAVAIVYLYNAVTWYDHVTLADGTKVVLVERTADGQFVIERGGRRETVTPAQVRRVGTEQLPDVELGVRSVVARANLTAAIIAILLFLPAPFVQSLRLVWMLAVQDVRIGLWDAIKLTFAGNFFNFALPGTTGGDLIKAYYITHYTHHKTEAVTTVFLDRAIGLLGLMLLATVMIVYAWDQLPWDAAMRRSLITALGLVWAGLALGALMVFSARLRGLLRLSSLAARLPAGEHLLRIGRATVAMRRHKSLVLASLGNTLVLQALVVFSAYLMASALNMAGGFELYFVCVPIGFLIAAIPISPPQAFGVMEWAYIQFFAQNGLNDPSQALALALAARLTQLVWALPGMLVPLLGAHLPNRRELDELEQPDADAAGSRPSPDPPTQNPPDSRADAAESGQPPTTAK